jgi:hypothetical protein
MSCLTGGLCAPRPRPRWTCRPRKWPGHRRGMGGAGRGNRPPVDAGHPIRQFGHRPGGDAAWRSGGHAGRLCRDRSPVPPRRRAGAPVRPAGRGWDPLLDWAESGSARVSCRPRASCHRCSRNPRSRLSQPCTGGCIPADRAARSRQSVGLPRPRPCRGAWAAGPAGGWRLSRIDEDWQIEQWGEDEEAAEVAARKLGEFLHAKRFWTLSSRLTHNAQFRCDGAQIVGKCRSSCNFVAYAGSILWPAS